MAPPPEPKGEPGSGLSYLRGAPLRRVREMSTIARNTLNQQLPREMRARKDWNQNPSQLVPHEIEEPLSCFPARDGLAL